MPYDPLIEIQLHNKRTVWINPQLITNIKETVTNDFFIYFMNGNHILLEKEELEQLFNRAYQTTLIQSKE